MNPLRVAKIRKAVTRSRLDVKALRLIRTDRVDDKVSDDGKGRLVGGFHFICSGYEGVVRVVD